MRYEKGTRVFRLRTGGLVDRGTVVGNRTTTGWVSVLWDGRSSPQRVRFDSVERERLPANFPAPD